MHSLVMLQMRNHNRSCRLRCNGNSPVSPYITISGVLWQAHFFTLVYVIFRFLITNWQLQLTAIHHQGLAISSSNIYVRPLFHSNSYSFFTKACLLLTRKSAHLKVPTMWPSYVKVCHNHSKSLIFYPVGRHIYAHHSNLSSEGGS